MHDIAGHTDRRAGVLADLAHFTTLKPDNDVLACHDLGTVLASLFLLRDNRGIGTRSTAEYRRAIRARANVVDDSADRNHVQRQAVPSPTRLRSQDTVVNNTAHALNQLFWNARPIALHNISSAHALGCHDIALLARRLIRDQRDVCAPARIVLDTVNDMRAGLPAVEVDNTNAPLGTTTAVPDSDATRVVPTTLAKTLFGKRQGQEWATLPEVIVDGTSEMAKTGCPRLVGAHLDGVEIV